MSLACSDSSLDGYPRPGLKLTINSQTSRNKSSRSGDDQSHEPVTSVSHQCYSRYLLDLTVKPFPSR